MKKLHLISAILLAFVTLNAFALAKQYQIELIAFEQVNSEALDSEQWPMVTPVEPEKTSPDITLLDPAQYQLSNAQSLLKRDPHYKILMHIAWQETLAQLNKHQTVHLYGGLAYDDNGNPLSNIVLHEDTPYNQFPRWELNGNVTVQLNRYFNFNFDIYFAEPLKSLSRLSMNGYFSNGNAGLFYFHLLQNRRTKSDELNYIDYPLYGMLLKVIPIQEAAKPKSSAPPVVKQ